MKTKTKTKNPSAVEGEGSYTATHNYNAGLQKSVKAGHSDQLAQQAKKALEGPEGVELLEAERIGKAGHPKRNQP